MVIQNFGAFSVVSMYIQGELRIAFESFTAKLGTSLERFDEFRGLARESFVAFWRVSAHSLGKLCSVLKSFGAQLRRGMECFEKCHCIVKEGFGVFWRVSGHSQGELPTILESFEHSQGKHRSVIDKELDHDRVSQSSKVILNYPK